MPAGDRQPPSLRQEAIGADPRVRLSGDWTLSFLAPRLEALRRQLQAVAGDAGWDLSGVTRLDSFGAVLLWRHWGRRRPDGLVLPAELEGIFGRLAELGETTVQARAPYRFLDGTAQVGRAVFGFARHLVHFVALVGQLCLDLVYLLRYRGHWPLLEISANFYKVGVQAMPVTALVGFLIGVVLSYLSALQLQLFGADVFIVNILGFGIIRELGPVLVAVLVAGRSGSAITAQIGVMRVTEEIDALSTMGISRSIRVVLPKIFGLTVAMPLLVLWTSSVALLGGMLAALLQLDLSLVYFLENLPRAVPVANLLIGLGKGVVFGFVIAVVACHFGLHVRPNTESLSANTTSAVVTAITTVILVDAVFAIFTRHVGVPQL